jgi:hypothetical protein
MGSINRPTPSLGLGAGRSQVQILSPRYVRSPGTAGNKRENPRKHWGSWSAVLVCSRLFPALGTAKGPQESCCGPFCAPSAGAKRMASKASEPEQSARFRVERSRDLDDRVERDVELAALDGGEVGAIEARVSRETIVAVAAPLAGDSTASPNFAHTADLIGFFDIGVLSATWERRPPSCEPQHHRSNRARDR